MECAMSDEPLPPLAIEGGPPHRETRYPAAPPIEPAADEAPVEALEVEFARTIGVPEDCVVALAGPAHAWAALFGAVLDASSRREDAEIVVPALLGDEAAAAARALGVTVVPGEVDANTATLSARGLVRALSERTAIAVAAHAFGHPAAFEELARVANDRGVLLVEDASDALGASLRGVPAGRMGEGAVFAIGRQRALTGGSQRGDSGALVVLRDAERADRLRAERDHDGESLDEAVARIALTEVRRLHEALEARQRLAWELTFHLRGDRAISGMPHGRWIRHAYPRYVIRLRGILWKRSLADTIEAIRAEGVDCEPALGLPLHLDAAIRGALPEDERLSDEHFAAAARLPDELIAIPLHEALTSRDMDDVAAVLRKVERWSV
jgi:perosamine synthetase